MATATLVGAAALRAGLAPPTGCVTELADFAGARLPGFGHLVFGGHDITAVPVGKHAEELARDGVVPVHLVEQVRADLAAAEAEIRTGYAAIPGAADQATDQAGAARMIRADIVDFQRRHRLDRVVVVNVASTEPRATPPELGSPAELEDALAHRSDLLAPSSLYAYAAISAGFGYVDFTPSTGGRLPALQALARRCGVPYAGSDAKTGETLVKSALAPMFSQRALQVRSWSGTNLLGGGDGATLANPRAARSKIAAKERLTAELLGGAVDGVLHIDHVPSLGDWKTAWDHITFAGFLGVGMTLQFTWQGCDSALAAPLVLDLARLVAAAARAGVAGPVPELAFFFKDPVGTSELGLSRQYDTLSAWARSL